MPEGLGARVARVFEQTACQRICQVETIVIRLILRFTLFLYPTIHNRSRVFSPRSFLRQRRNLHRLWTLSAVGSSFPLGSLAVTHEAVGSPSFGCSASATGSNQTLDESPIFFSVPEAQVSLSSPIPAGGRSLASFHSPSTNSFCYICTVCRRRTVEPFFLARSARITYA